MELFGITFEKQDKTYRQTEVFRLKEIENVINKHTEPKDYHVWEENFKNFSPVISDADPPTIVPGWTCEQTNTTGGVSISSSGLELDSEGSAQHDGLIMYGTNATYNLTGSKKIIYECRAKFTQGAAGTAAKTVFAIGLAEDGSGFVASGSLANKEFIGFCQETGGDGSIYFGTNANGTEKLDDTGVDITLGNTYNFRFEVVPGSSVDVWVNDTYISLSNVTKAYIPIKDDLRPAFYIGADAASNDPLLTLKHIKIVTEV